MGSTRTVHEQTFGRGSVFRGKQMMIMEADYNVEAEADEKRKIETEAQDGSGRWRRKLMMEAEAVYGGGS